MQPISIIVHTRNEAGQISDCLMSLRDWAAEVIVCDMESSDGTLSLAIALASKVMSIPFMDEFDAARNLSAAEATQPWILFLDADERLTAEVKATIARLVASDDPSIAAYQLPFKTVSFGKWIEHAGNWWPSYKSPPLLRKGRFWFSGKVHDPARIDGRVERILPRSSEDAIIHYSHRDLSHYLDKLNRYTSLEVGKLDGERPPSWQDVATRLGTTFRWYFDDTQGRNDGRAGFLLSFGSALYEAIVQLKALECSGAESIPSSAEEFLLLAAQSASPRLPVHVRSELSIVPGIAITLLPGRVSLNAKDQEPQWLDWETQAVEIKLKIAATTHRNALGVLGGGEVQLFESVRALYEKGVSCLVGIGTIPGEGELTHVYSLHVEEINDNLISQGRPYVLSPIYWDRAELAWVAPRLISAVARAETLADIREAYSSIKSQVEVQKAGFVTELSEAQRALVRGAAVILPNALCEAEKLQHSMGEDLPTVKVIPNAISPATTMQPFDGLPESPFILCVGRVEANKNQLSLILACRMLSMPVVLIGNQPDPQYVNLCQRVGGPDCFFLGSKSRSEVVFAMRAAAAHCLPSFGETPGLVNLEAALQGCPIVCSNRGAEREYFADSAHYCDPLDLESIAQGIQLAMTGSLLSPSRLPTWADVADNLLEVYKQVLRID